MLRDDRSHSGYGASIPYITIDLAVAQLLVQLLVQPHGNIDAIRKSDSISYGCCHELWKLGTLA